MQTRSPSRLRRVLITFVVFVLIGPAIGSLTFGALVTIVTLFTDPDVGATFLIASIAFMPLAYMIGGLQAAFVGAATAYSVWKSGRAPLKLPLAAAALAGVYSTLTARDEPGIAAIMVMVHLVGALGCWLILRRIFGWEKG